MKKNVTYSSYAKEVNEKIKDPLLKEVLFGMDDIEGEDIKGIGVLYKMMTFTFMFTYAKYKYDRDHKKFRAETTNTKRVVSIMAKISVLTLSYMFLLKCSLTLFPSVSVHISRIL